MAKISAIVPAYNEENTVAAVVTALTSSPMINRVIVVSDGSVDNTASEAKQCGADVLDLPYNRGKGAAMLAGLKCAKSEIVAFFDADLIGLTSKHIDDLCVPILTRHADMSIGVFKSGKLMTDLAQKISPNLSGQRVVRTEVITALWNEQASDYDVEVALTNASKKNKLDIEFVILDNLTQLIKEQKFGLMKGLWARSKMYWQILMFSFKHIKRKQIR